jgi:parallel beta-helix repeat protein
MIFGPGLSYGPPINFGGIKSLTHGDCINNNWIIDDSVGYDDTSSFRSGLIECIGSSQLCVTLTGPAIVSFWWKTDTTPNRGLLLFLVNDTIFGECNSSEWTKAEYAVDDLGTHKIKWMFKKIKSYPKWQGCGWVDNVSIIRDEYISSNTALPNKSLIILKNEAAIEACNRDTIHTIINESQCEANAPSISRYNRTSKIGPRLDLKSPNESDFLSMNVPISFAFFPVSYSRIMRCSLLIDGMEKSRSRIIINNSTNVITYLLKDDDVDLDGLYEWQIKCYSCGDNCMSSDNSLLTLLRKNKTTYVDLINHDESRFIYQNVQDAIDNVLESGTVKVNTGIYPGHIYINKPLHLKGNVDSIIACKNDKDALIINSSDVTISGLIINGGFFGISNVVGKHVNNINILNNIIYNSSHGIHLTKCNNITIDNNIINNTFHQGNNLATGIWLEACRDSSLTSNKINAVIDSNRIMMYGMYLKSCNDFKKIKSNRLNNSTNGFYLYDTKIDSEDLINSTIWGSNITYKVNGIGIKCIR